MVFKKSVFFECPLFLPKNDKNPLKFWSGKDQEKNIENRPKIDPKIDPKLSIICQKRLENCKSAKKVDFSKYHFFDDFLNSKNDEKGPPGDWT